jgi:hypothetical protein
MLVSLALVAISPMLGIAGGILCCFAPPKSNTRPLILVSVSLDGMGLAIGTTAAVVTALAQNEQSFAMKTVVDLLTFLMSLGSFILFMLFLKKLALYLKDEGTATEAHDVMVGRHRPVRRDGGEHVYPHSVCGRDLDYHRLHLLGLLHDQAPDPLPEPAQRRPAAADRPGCLIGTLRDSTTTDIFLTPRRFLE